jgi:glycosyltransferase involved in cell wall biosynthesis
MNILLVSSFYPYPLLSGGQVRLYNLLRHLSKQHKVTLIAETRENLPESDYDEIKKYCVKILTVKRPKQWSVKNILRTGFSFYPFLLVGHFNKDMQKIIKEEIQSNIYDLIHVETFYVMHNLPKTSLPTILTEHNIEYQIYWDFVNNFKFIFLKPFLWIDVLKLKFWEQFFWRKADQIIAVSKAEKIIIEKSINKKVLVVANGVDCDYFSRIIKKEPKLSTILFVGSFRWIQNRDAAAYLLSNIWPILKEKFGSVIKLQIVGNEANTHIKNLDDPQIEINDCVQDIRKVYATGTLLLAPIKIGGGTKFKILESMASGLPVVTTPEGVEGLENYDNTIFVGKNDSELIYAAEKILTDNNLRKHLITREKEFVRKYYDWGEITEKLESAYNQLVKKYDYRY